MQRKILLVDDDFQSLMGTKLLLEDAGHFIDTLQNIDEVFARIADESLEYALIILDFHLPKYDGVFVIKSIREKNPEQYILVYTGDTESRDIVKETFRNGAVDFIEKGEDPAILLAAVQRWSEKFRIESSVGQSLSSDENKQLITEMGMVGRSQALAHICHSIKICEASASLPNILIRGETGTGKEVLARTIHNNSLRKNGPFIAINCGAIPENLIESELFGHERGAFTGAHVKKIGAFELADGGTLFLDEIGDASHATQLRLLRALQEKKIRTVGGSREISVDIRIITATHRDLTDLVGQGKFRQDLYYRLDVISLTMPPLRERIEDIAPLVQHFCRLNFKMTNIRKKLDLSAVRVFENYSWPGNVRELENCVTRILAQSPETLITSATISKHLFQTNMAPLTMNDLVKRQESQLVSFISDSLQLSKSVREAARKMGVSKSTLYGLLKKFGMDKEKIKNPKEFDHAS